MQISELPCYGASSTYSVELRTREVQDLQSFQSVNPVDLIRRRHEKDPAVALCQRPMSCVPARLARQEHRKQPSCHRLCPACKQNAEFEALVWPNMWAEGITVSFLSVVEVCGTVATSSVKTNIGNGCGCHCLQVSQSLKVQVLNYKVSTQNHSYDSEYGNPKSL